MKKNVVNLIGHLGADVETRHLENGQVSNFSLATTEKYKNKKGDTVEETEWTQIVCWDKTSEIAEKYLKKGSLVGIEGKLKTRQWEDKQGNKRYTTEVVANSILMLSRSTESKTSNPSKPEASSSEEDDDLPF